MWLLLWSLWGTLPAHPAPETASWLRLEARLQGVVCILEAGPRLEVLGDTLHAVARGDTLVVTLRHRVGTWLARWGWAPDTVVVRLPEALPAEIQVDHQGGLLVLRGRSLRIAALMLNLRHTRAFLTLEDTRTLGPVVLRAFWSEIHLGPLPRRAPEYLHLQTNLCRVFLDLRTPPDRSVPVVLAAQFSDLRLYTDGAPVLADRQGLLNLGPLPRSGSGPGYRLLVTGNLNRLRVFPNPKGR